MPVRVRVGPSLRRRTSVGAFRFALFNYALATADSGSFVIRIEDTDQARGRPELIDELYRTLAWAGIDYHEGGQRGGPFGPYRQSLRAATYTEHAQRLLDEGMAYRCFCTPAEVARIRAKQSARRYDGRCARLDAAAATERAERGESHVIRMQVPRDPGRTSTVRDIVHGEVTIPLDVLDDQVLLKSDGMPTYHFSSVVDDHLMAITHVLRSASWLASTPKHLLLYDWFGWPPPSFVHVPALDGGIWATDVEQLRANGIPPDAMVNFVAALGWHHTRLSDVFTLRDLTSVFDLRGFGTSCGSADPARLEWLSAQHLRHLPLAEAAEQVVPHLRAARLPVLSGERRQQALQLCLSRCRTLADVADKFGYLFAAPDLDRETLAELAPARDHLAAAFGPGSPRPSTPETLASWFPDLAKTRGIPLRRLLELVRLAVCGVRSTPDTFVVLAFLGHDECAARVSGR
jgi:glutamyl-tRNA synthetase